MGLTCRLLGHSFGETETEREREERGDEVVVSVRELQVCSRCGHEHVISENKEVTAIRTPEEVGMTDGEVDTAAAGFEPAEPQPGTDDVDVDEIEDEPVIETAPDPETEAETSSTEATAEADVEADVDEGADEPEVLDEPPVADNEPPVTDDAIILDDDGSERDRTQWPEDVDAVETEDPTPQPGSAGDDAEFIDADAETSVPDSDASREYGAWPDPPGEDEGWDAHPDDGEPASISFGGGLTPESNGATSSDSDGEFIEASPSDDDEFVRAGASERSTDVPDDEVEYYCPNCGHARRASSSSMRAGDICPECRKGYIAEREA